MNVLVTGAFGRCGTAIIDHLDDQYAFEYTDLPEAIQSATTGSVSTSVVDVTDRQAFTAACAGVDAIVHLAGYSDVESTFDDVHGPNILGVYNVLEAAREQDVRSVVFASSNHVMGRYENELAPDLYTDETITLDHNDPPRPDSFYAASKLFGEYLGRFYVSEYEYPEQYYALRIGSLRSSPYDHPYGDAEKGVEDGRWERDSQPYRRQVARLKALWLSRRDFAHLVEQCLEDDDVTFGIFNAVSGNRTRWLDISRAKGILGYEPRDDGASWSEQDRPTTNNR